MHTTHFPAPDSGRSTSCSSAFRVSVAPWCLFHEVDQVHGVVVHFPVSREQSLKSDGGTHLPRRGVPRGSAMQFPTSAPGWGLAELPNVRLGRRKKPTKPTPAERQNKGPRWNRSPARRHAAWCRHHRAGKRLSDRRSPPGEMHHAFIRFGRHADGSHLGPADNVKVASDRGLSSLH
jgi:hypothetical protein